MHFSYLLAIVGLTGAAIAAPAPDAEPNFMRRAEEAQANAQDTGNGQNGQNGQWWPGGGWHPWYGGGYGGWHPWYGGGWGGGYGGWHH